MSAALVAWLLSTGATVRAENGELAGYESDYVRLLAFVGGSQLSQAERSSADAYIRNMFERDPSTVRTGDATVRPFLAKLPSSAEWFRSEQREELREQFEALSTNDASRVIVEAHDPTIVFDRVNKRLVSERTLVEWRRAYAWVANLFGVAGPSDAFVADARSYVKTRYATLPDEFKNAIAHVERNYPVGIDMVGRYDKGSLAKMKRLVQNEAQDPHVLALDAANLMSVNYHRMINELVTRGALVNSAANYNMLYHRGYYNGNYR